VYDYNNLSTNRLARLKGQKERERWKLDNLLYPSSKTKQEVEKLTIELRHINAVLHARFSTLPLWGDK
jgi:hypothetical protein